MCGIIGYVGPKKVVPVLLDGLKRLEYRGYDSAGVAFLQQGELQIYRSVGKIKELENILWGKTLGGDIGIGHTRWATHGRPSEENAHPHVDCTGDIVLVHNGIIENYVPLKEKLVAEGHRFTSDTDTEVIVHLIEKYLEGDLEEATRRALSEVSGAYAVAAMWKGDPDRIVGARCSSPLVVGLGEGEFLVASDIPALLAYTRNVLFLEDHEIAVVSREGQVVAYDQNGQTLWQRELDEVCYYGAPVYHEGALFVATAGNGLWKLDATTGAVVWRVALAGPSYATPLIDNGRIFIGDNNGVLRVFGTDGGQLVTQRKLDREIQGRPLIWSDLLLVGSRDHKVHAFKLVEPATP